jgi:glycerophosphoryl diester phosphodiesterase
VHDAPLLIAHRAGNHPGSVRAAAQAGADVIEADLHLWRGRLDLRHLKTVGSLPLYWDRWAVAPPWRRFDSLDDLLAAAPPQTSLMLDLKGRDPAAAQLLAASLGRHPRAASTFVSAREWRLLEAIDPRLALRIGSAARPRQLERLIAYAASHPLDGASLHLRLLRSDRLASLRARVPLILTWPVNRRHEATRAAALGVGGLIIDDLRLLAELRDERT